MGNHPAVAIIFKGIAVPLIGRAIGGAIMASFHCKACDRWAHVIHRHEGYIVTGVCPSCKKTLYQAAATGVIETIADITID